MVPRLTRESSANRRRKQTWSVVALVVVLLGLAAASASTGVARSACAPQRVSATNAGSLPRSLLKILGVFRSTATRVNAHVLPPPLVNAHADFYVNSVRRVGSAFGDTFYLYVAGEDKFVLQTAPCQKPTVGVYEVDVTSPSSHQGDPGSGPYTAALIERNASVDAVGTGRASIVTAIVPDGI